MLETPVPTPTPSVTSEEPTSSESKQEEMVFEPITTEQEKHVAEEEEETGDQVRSFPPEIAFLCECVLEMILRLLWGCITTLILDETTPLCKPKTGSIRNWFELFSYKEFPK